MVLDSSLPQPASARTGDETEGRQGVAADHLGPPFPERVLDFGTVDVDEAGAVQAAGRTVIDDLSGLQRHQARAVAQRIVDLVQTDHDADGLSGVQVAQQLHHLPRRRRIQRGHRLVGQDDLGALDQGPGDRRPLLLAAGERAGALAGLVGDPDPVQRPHYRDLLRRRPEPEEAAPDIDPAEHA